MMNWLKESNRLYHFLGGIVLSFLFTFFCSLGAAAGMEFKDVQYHNQGISKPWKYKNWSSWDWLDFSATILGGVVGQALQALCFYVFV